MLNFLKNNFIYALLILAALICFWGGLIYWLYALTVWGVVLNLALSLVSFIIILRPLSRNHKAGNGRPKPSGRSGKILTLIYFLFWAGGLLFLISARTSKSLVSPWDVVSEWFFIFFFGAGLVLFFLILKDKGRAKPLLHFHAFLMFSVAVIVYQIGYGFDPFIHEATLKLIDKAGLVTPKPVYYLGQYSLVITLHKISFIPIALLNKFLVPVLGALFLPEVLDRGLKPVVGAKNSLLIIFFLPLLTFAPFIITVPQSLAYIFLIAAVALAGPARTKTQLEVVILLTLAVLVIHPLAGIPALFFSLSLLIFQTERRHILRLPKRFYHTAIFLASAFSLPAAFIYGARAQFSPHLLTQLLPDLKTNLPGKENFVLNFVYLFNTYKEIIILALVLVGVWTIYHCRKKLRYKNVHLNVHFNLGLALLIAYFISRAFLDFNFLIDYEQNNYSQRILVLALIFFLPFIVAAFYRLIQKISLQDKAVKIPMLVFGLLLLPSSLYLSYPRMDNYHNPHFHSVGSADLKAVQWIEKNAQKDYIVLANQQVGVAALREFGFNRYYKNDIYFYPIPTGGQLYQYYLDMVYEKPSRTTMLRAMEFAGVDKGYFVLNQYWWAFDKIKQEAKLEANSWKSIDRDKVLVFEFNK